MAETTEPRALSAALAGPAFATRGGGLAMHTANRHVERWAPETAEGTSRSRPLRSLGFVDRLISPWVEAAQRSASHRLFSQYRTEGMPERQGGEVSWVFPRPWYQDELDWMAAARKTAMAPRAESASPTLLTTRGTYVPPASAPAAALPSALYEYVAPSLSVAQPTVTGTTSYDAPVARAYSPLVSLAAVQAAEVMSRTVGRLPVAASTPALRTVLSSLLERTATPSTVEPTRMASLAPEMVTPPAPSLPREPESVQLAESVADRYAQQHVQIAELQRIARQAAVASQPDAARAEAARAETLRTEAQRVETARTEAARTETQAAAARNETQAAARAEATRIDAQRAEATRDVQRTEAQRAEALRAEATRAEALRAEALRAERAGSTAEQARVAEETRKAQVEAQQQLEERIARRAAERGSQRLHDQARSDAAAHARAAALEPTASMAIAETRSAEQREQAVVRREPPPAIAAAIAALPPELATLIAQRPDRAVQTINELDQAYRAVELMARSAAAGGSFEVTRGPRLMMPSGLGGLVAAIDQAPSIAPAFAAPAAPARAPGTFAPRAMAPRAPLPFVAPRAAIAPTSALGATTTAQPAALAHVAWSDRWLARFAGASPRTLETLTASTARGDDVPRMLNLATTAPDAIFVAPSEFDAVRDGERVRFDDQGHAIVLPPQRALPVATAAPTLTIAAALDSGPATSGQAASGQAASGQAASERFDDDAETPDEVFAQISAAASQRRAAPAPEAATIGVRSASTAPTAIPMPPAPLPTLADSIAHAAPLAPSAGLAAHLASSPFAPALRHVLALPSATSFDVRALFGGALSASYLAGLLAPETSEVELASRALPAFASRFAALAGEPGMTTAERVAPDWDAAYVAPDVPREADAITGELAQPEVVAQVARTHAPLTTLRSALLSWEGEVVSAAPTAAGASAPTAAIAAGEVRVRALQSSTARDLIEGMSMPLLGDRELPRDGQAWASPGMVAERAHGWSVAQERSAADLAFDFVPPELVLAARVYGLGPAEAAQAARIAIAGPGQLAAMASTVDRTFVQAMAFEAERRAAREGRTDVSRPDLTRPDAPRIAQAEAAYPVGTDVVVAGRYAEPAAPSASAFGVERRTPRGAFLWPPATVAALKLDAPAPDGQQSMSIAALELLAAQTVAELGTYAALGPYNDIPRGLVDDRTGEPAAATPADPAQRALVAAAQPSTARGAPELVEANEGDVVQAAIAMVPQARRARFEALYLALGRTTGATASPAARAARALALAGRGEDAALSASERAASAWDVLPVVYAAEQADAEADIVSGVSGIARRSPIAGASYTAPGQQRYSRFGEMTPEFVVDGRPGLSSLSARAGEAIGSYVTPIGGSSSTASAPSSSSSSSSSSQSGAVTRVPTAAQEMVQTGRPSGRFGGGETEIPTWFEAAARKMFEQQNGSLGGDISIAELTLIQSAPTNQIAASTRGTPGAGPSAPGLAQHGEPKPGQQVDIEKIANEIYRQILAMMDAARARNGEPYL